SYPNKENLHSKTLTLTTMKRSRLKFWIGGALALLLGTLSFPSQAQIPQNIDVSLEVNADGTLLELYVRPSETYSAAVNQIGYTLKWPIAAGVTLGDDILPCPSGIPWNAIAPIQEDGFNYAFFVALSPASLSDACPDQVWQAGEWQLIHQVPVLGNTGCVPFEVAN